MMGLTFFPYDNKVYSGDDFRGYTAPKSTGVYSAPGHFDAAAAGNTVTVDTGIAWLKFDKLKGGSITLGEAADIEVPAITGAQIARLFIGADVYLNTSWLEFRVGENPNDPNIQPTRNNMVCEVCPWEVSIVDGLYVLKDNRIDETLCGVMKSEVESIPTQGIVDKATAMLNALQTAYDSIVTREGLMLMSEYDTGEDVRSAGGIPTYIKDATLVKGGAEPYTPTGDYDPATKKYVDGLVSAEGHTFYVDALAGRDDHDGSEGAPFATIAKAVEHIPRVSGNVEIVVASGTYNERISLSNTVGGRHIRFTGGASLADSANHRILGVSASRVGGELVVRGFSLTDTSAHGFIVAGSGSVLLQNSRMAVVSSFNAVRASTYAKVRVLTCSITGRTGDAIVATEGAEIYVQDSTVSTSGRAALAADYGSVSRDIRNNILTAATSIYIKSNGAQIVKPDGSFA